MKRYFLKNVNSAIIQGLLIIFLIALTRCEDEQPVQRDYPRLSGTIVSNVTDSGAVFSADLYSLGNENIIQYGFIWSMTDGSLSNSERVYLGVPGQPGIFSASITTTLKDGTKYTVKPFVETEKRIVYGPVTTFMSMGSKGPSITDFWPVSAGWRDTIRIFGQNFSFLYNKVLLNNTLCPMVRANDTVICALVPHNLITDENILSVEVSNTRATMLQKKFILIRPTIKDFYPKQAHWGDTITIKGKYLSTVSYTGNTVKLGNINCTIIETKDTLVRILVDYKVNAISNVLLMDVNGIKITAQEQLTLLPPPAYFSFTPVEGTWNSLISLSGRFVTNGLNNSIMFNSEPTNIQDFTPFSMKVKVPATLKDSLSVIKYVIGPFTFSSDNKFKLYPPVIKSFSPQTGAGGTSIIIKGKYFNNLRVNGTYVHKTIVKFGEVEVKDFYVQNDSTILATVPSGVYGPVQITISVNSQQFVSVNHFTVTNPLISSFSPQTGTFTNEVTINGTYLSGASGVRFGNFTGTIVSQSANQIVARVPVTMDSIPATINVFVGNNTASSQEKFTLADHSILSVSGSYIPGGEIHITGYNFNPNPSLNAIYWGSYKLKVKRATPNEIVAEWSSLPKGTNKIMVQTGGYKRYSNESFSVSSAWTDIPSPQIKTSYWNYCGAIQNYGYVLSPAMNATYRFNPVDQKWTNLGITYPYGNPYYYRAASAVLNDKFYIIGGYGYLHEYNPVSNSWQAYSNVSFSSEGVSFALNNRLWYGLHNGSPSRNEFYEINPENNFSYVRKGDFPLPVPSSLFASYFTIANKGYIIFSNNQVWQFNPDNLTWQRKNDFPGQSRTGAVSFIVGNYAYFGLGVLSGISFDDIWKYDPSTDAWSLKARIPNPRYSAIAFTITNKAYIGFGYGQNGNQLFDFYEFDPSF